MDYSITFIKKIGNIWKIKDAMKWGQQAIILQLLDSERINELLPENSSSIRFANFDYNCISNA